MDFRVKKAIGRDIEEDYEALIFGLGYDHNWCLNGSGFRKVAEMSAKESGITEFAENYIENADIVISVGGDGSMLRAAKAAANAGKNVLGINAGRLAYLCGLDVDEIYLLSYLKSGKYSVQKWTSGKKNHPSRYLKIPVQTGLPSMPESSYGLLQVLEENNQV